MQQHPKLRPDHSRERAPRSRRRARPAFALALRLCLPALSFSSSCSPSPPAADRSGRAAAPAEASRAGTSPRPNDEPRDATVEADDSLVVRYWVAGCSVSEDLWRYRKSSTVTCDERGRFLQTAHGSLTWPGYVTAGEMDTLIVEGEDLDGLRFELAWSADDTFPPGRSARPVTDGASSRAIRFDLRAAPEWQGRVRRFRLTWSGAPSRAARVLGARGTARSSPQSAP